MSTFFDEKDAIHNSMKIERLLSSDTTSTADLNNNNNSTSIPNPYQNVVLESSVTKAEKPTSKTSTVNEIEKTTATTTATEESPKEVPESLIALVIILEGTIRIKIPTSRQRSKTIRTNRYYKEVTEFAKKTKTRKVQL